jgi:lysophospholipase L1-like esterase
MTPDDTKLIPTLAVPGFYADSPQEWMRMHESHVKRAKQGHVDVLFLGDSITQGWNHAPQVFGKVFGQWKTALFGIRGDKTGNLLWRLDHGEVDGLSPRVVVLLIGVNNLWGAANTDTEVAIGIVAVTDRIRLKLPDAKILLMGLLPTGEHIDLPVRNAIRRVNHLLANAQLGQQIRYCDIGSALLDEEGSISKEVMADFLHPTPLGYERSAKVLAPIISEMMK